MNTRNNQTDLTQEPLSVCINYFNLLESELEQEGTTAQTTALNALVDLSKGLEQSEELIAAAVEALPSGSDCNRSKAILAALVRMEKNQQELLAEIALGFARAMQTTQGEVA